MSLNAEQTELVNRGINAKNPFDIGFCFNAALEAMKNNFWTIVIGHIIWLAAIVVLELTWIGILLVPAMAIGMFRFNLKFTVCNFPHFVSVLHQPVGSETFATCDTEIL